MYFLISTLIGYLFGCLNGSQLVAKRKHIDIKKLGSKNAGASNTTMLLGWKYGIFVALVDIFKATFAILLMVSFLEFNGIMDEYQIILLYNTAFFVVLGHNYPITMNFKGGKGTASIIGAFLAIDYRIAIIGVIILLLVTFTTDYAVLGVLSMYVAYFIETYMVYGINPARIVLVLILIGTMKHWENLKRIMNKEEIKLSSIYRNRTS
ncbi:glycerol-3-phosphate acyltransferase [Oceanobacillus sp. Castelsardo]|uniref:glycerol-3-phosphate acyltransferase n=1 Tax=Oceanobacillus sp. Castelsardo TaxID=1851204 RepID=UPI0008391239|nr:glycerol-3-phosphate acyltransferase [Oceanobacillus sp. Castelsardo]